MPLIFWLCSRLKNGDIQKGCHHCVCLLHTWCVIQGSGTSHTLDKLGSVNAIGGSFTLALAAAITIYMMTKFALPISTTQAIVGAIIGWNFFTGNHTDSITLEKIVLAWIAGPVIGAVFAVLLYIAVKKFKNSARIHLIRFESYIKTGLILVGAFGAYSLGAIILPT